MSATTKEISAHIHVITTQLNGFENGIFRYKNILIDTDCEPDDKAALQVLFKSLALHQVENPTFVYPKITIIAGSSTTPAIKEAEIAKIVSDLLKSEIIPSHVKITVIKGSATNKDHPSDGEELLDKNTLKTLSEKENPNLYSESAIKTITDFLQNTSKEESCYIALREVKDLRKACQNLTIKKFENVDFLGTLSFNVRNQYKNTCHLFLEEVLTRFRNSLCYENFHSACNKSCASQTWAIDNFKEKLKAFPQLSKAAEIWNHSNIRQCMTLLCDRTHVDGIPKRLSLSTTAISKTNKLLGETYAQSLSGNLQSETLDAFKAKVIAAMELNTKPLDEKSADFIKLMSYLRPFYNMVFFSPQICLADLAFMGVICHPEILKGSIQSVHLKYINGEFSNLEDTTSVKNTNFIKLTEERLVLLGKKVIHCLFEDIKQQPKLTINTQFNTHNKAQEGSGNSDTIHTAVINTYKF